ncbi:MAG: DUF3416 domain-containing protein [Candidatus Ancillula sp.]|jgi:starch synthase (maltosyl-transferring)|nr:DUF3416 domain-containing protein [Candidatus Ancillula sp.]
MAKPIKPTVKNPNISSSTVKPVKDDTLAKSKSSATEKARHRAKVASSSLPEVEIIERFPVINVSPAFEGGRFAPKVITDEVFPIDAKIFREGHDRLGATAVVVDVDGCERRFPMHPVGYSGDDNWQALVQAPSKVGESQFYIEGWSDDYHTWEHIAWIKVPGKIDVDLTFSMGALVFEKWANQLEREQGTITPNYDNAYMDDAIRTLRNVSKSLTDSNILVQDRLNAASSDQIHDIWNSFPMRTLVSASRKYPLTVQRPLSSFCSWYQFFPRSEGAVQNADGSIISGNFKTAAKSLDRVKDMGFDVIYVPPIHPIGQSFRKGKNNTLDAGADDVGSPWAIGSELGGHDAIHPDLGTLSDFKQFVARAKELELEVSIDIALQASPDHPWVKAHPDWFVTRPDGSIAYAENPPKKYQDIYPLNFDTDPDGIVEEVLRILRFWISTGVTVFRIDNPHTKPVWFWQFVIADIKRSNPEVIWLAEAFTLPSMMKTLGLVGFDQSHSYFLWRNTKQELSEFLPQVAGNDSFWFRPSFWPTTPDNLTDYLAVGGASAHAVRAILAAMGSPTWGIYAGYEFVEHQQRQNPDGTYAVEHVDSEKYQIKIRDWSKVDQFGMRALLTRLNQIRKEHFACQNFHDLQVQTTDNDAILCISRHIPGKFTRDGKDDTIIVVINLDCGNAQKSTVYLDYTALNLPGTFRVVDLLDGKEFGLGQQFFVDLAPVVSVAHIFHVQR